ncbi:aldehyde oxidase GLOX-like [Andrographis paniculata]|uniref:aldehyde oxidase GLOX-like n=1 Tax=Andrographis paniculata TaxID=175694 RepID=UPI0021E7519C|nr:aldehyde oxidase GLOX-like [Andrographis paniculata]
MASASKFSGDLRRRDFFLILSVFLSQCTNLASAAGKWEVLVPNIGISAMHMQLLHTDRIAMFDRTDFGPSNISLPDGKCRRDPKELMLKTDCTAHSVEYDVFSNSIRPLNVLTDVWCSSGAVAPDGTLIQAGGFNDGERAVRLYKPCRSHSCDWEEINGALAEKRWYATSQILPDGRQIIVGGRQTFTYEFHPKSGSGDGARYLPFLKQTTDFQIENNLYPYVFLNTDGNLFIYANNQAILFDYWKEKVVRSYPKIPGGDPRNYPSTGSAVLLPLKDNAGPEVLVCGGAPTGSFLKVRKGKFIGALNTCGRIRINDLNPQWYIETMPMGRVMSDMLLLPTADVLILNGAGSGTAGWEFGRDPALRPVTYKPDYPAGSRFEVHAPSSRARMYHSSAVLLRDGRVLVGGSNPHQYYNFTGVMFPTDLSLEAFSPAYLDRSFAYLRPTIVSPPSPTAVQHGRRFPVRFTVPERSKVATGDIMVTMVAPSFTTHSFAMNQRLLILTRGEVAAVGKSTYEVPVVAPGSANLAPAGFYILFVSHKGIPGPGTWIQIK